MNWDISYYKPWGVRNDDVYSSEDGYEVTRVMDRGYGYVIVKKDSIVEKFIPEMDMIVYSSGPYFLKRSEVV